MLGVLHAKIANGRHSYANTWQPSFICCAILKDQYVLPRFTHTPSLFSFPIPTMWQDMRRLQSMYIKALDHRVLLKPYHSPPVTPSLTIDLILKDISLLDY